MLRWNNLSTWNSSFSDLSSIEVSEDEDEEPELKEEEEQITQSGKCRFDEEKQRSGERRSKEAERSEKQRKKL